MKTTILFDLDGTLLPFVQDEFIKLYFKGLCEKLAPLGYTSDSVVKDVWSGTGAMIRNDGARTNREVFWEYFRLKNSDRPDAEPLCDDFYKNEFDSVKSCLKYIPDRKPMIEDLKKAGFEVALATNPIFPECAVDTRMGWIGLDKEDFSYVTNYGNSSFCKPNPKYFEEILEKLGKKPSECVMIGNSIEEDILPADAIGMENFLVTEFLENPNGADISGYRQGTLEQAVEFCLSLK